MLKKRVKYMDSQLRFYEFRNLVYTKFYRVCSISCISSGVFNLLEVLLFMQLMDKGNNATIVVSTN